MNVNIKDFAHNLEGLKPKSKNIPEVIMDMYDISKNGDQHSSSASSFGPISELIDNYHADRIRFSDFALNSKLERVGREHLSFATSSHSVLCINKANLEGELYEYDRYTLNPLYPVAKDQKAFLDALLSIMELYSKKYDESSRAKKEDLEQEYVTTIVQKAGGDRYSAFYEGILL